ncbi:MAG TPA: HAD-IA family hydrolase [Candidatus Limnocylindrales bacterium]|jgi:putative hydrolase of the HAD superfamily|nr:HAD-IA family hydrolase [Candidatus Limnocylindrales bacterium]
MTGLARPEIVFFDLGDTLIRPEPSWAHIYLAVCRAFGLPVELDALERAMVAATRAGAWRLPGRFEASAEASYRIIRDFDEAVMASLGIGDLPDRFYREVGAAFGRAASWHVFPDVVPALDALAGAGIRRAVISNWVWEAPELLHTLELARRFERLIISARVGYQKPHRRIFERALAETGVRAESAVHVGDSYEADVEGARAAGIAAVLIRRTANDPARVRSDAPGGDAVPVVRDLFGLLDLLRVPAPAPAG